MRDEVRLDRRASAGIRPGGPVRGPGNQRQRLPGLETSLETGPETGRDTGAQSADEQPNGGIDPDQSCELKGSGHGSPRMGRKLRARRFPASKKWVERLMREHGIRARHKRYGKVTTDSKHPLPVAEKLSDLVRASQRN